MKRQLAVKIVLAGLWIGTGLSTLNAEESPFGYIYTADSAAKGEWEYEQWNTVRTGKAKGSYTSFDLRNEVQHGFTDRFQAALYLNSSYLYTHDVPDPDDPSANLANHSAFDINSVSLELKYQVLNPETGPFGFSLYLEPELGVRSPLTGEDEIVRGFEGKLIFEKELWEDRLTLASNVVFEPEWEREEDTRDKELKNEYSLGAAWRLSPAWTGGLELLNRRVFARQSFGRQEASAWFLGPNVHYAAKEWWATLTVLPQISGNPRYLGVDAQGNSVSDAHRTLGEYEKLEIRLKFGVEF